MNILVTGCGDDIGQSIGKILREEYPESRIIGCDMSLDHASLFIYNKVFKVPSVSHIDYRSQIMSIINQENIQLIIPSCEPELRFHTHQNVNTDLFGLPILMSNIESREIGFDKFKTSNFLKENNLPFPKTFLINEAQFSDGPFILKDRFGSGSKKIIIPENQEEFLFYQTQYPDFIAQELLNENQNEYTCGVFRSTNGEIRSITFRRTLTNGYSGFGEVIENDEVNSLLDKIAQKIKLIGSINVQLKFSLQGPCVFEINPRFSSTVLFRHIMGFNDLLWSINDLFGKPIKPFKKIKPGTKFYKGFNEYVTEP
jgi:carbamoyl-phosphate synthase large subunit